MFLDNGEVKVNEICTDHNHCAPPVSENVIIRPCHLTHEEREQIIDWRGLGSKQLWKIEEKVLALLKTRLPFDNILLAPGFLKNLKPLKSPLGDIERVDALLKEQEGKNNGFFYKVQLEGSDLSLIWMHRRA